MSCCFSTKSYLISSFWSLAFKYKWRFNHRYTKEIFPKMTHHLQSAIIQYIYKEDDQDSLDIYAIHQGVI